jgi:hypothetical protein
MRRVLAFGVALLPLALMGSCSSASLVASGGPCFQSIDCQLGLVCITPMGSDAGSCTNNLNGIVDVPPIGDAAQPDATPMMDVVTMDQVVKDNNVPETVVMETGAPETGPEDSSTTDAPAD